MATDERTMVVEELLARAEAGPVAVTRPLVGTCTQERHPTLLGRVRVRWETPEGTDHAAWVPVLQSVSVRRGDRVLVQPVENWPEPIVTGVLDGFATRPDADPNATTSLELKADEVVEIRGPDGAALAELRPGPDGPVLRIVNDALGIDVPGRLSLRADQLEFVARKGSVEISAGDDVVVKGEMIKLN